MVVSDVLSCTIGSLSLFSIVNNSEDVLSCTVWICIKMCGHMYLLGGTDDKSVFFCLFFCYPSKH